MVSYKRSKIFFLVQVIICNLVLCQLQGVNFVNFTVRGKRLDF